MINGAYCHALVISPGTYARHLYGERFNQNPDYWRHEDAARHMANHLRSTNVDLAVNTIIPGVSIPPTLWKDPHCLSACLFSQANRIVLLVPGDCAKHIAEFTEICLVPLLTRSKASGGRPDWYSRFIIAALGNVEIPKNIAPGRPFLKTIRFREYGWVRDYAALLMLETELRG